MKMLSSSLCALALVSLSLSPPLAANNGLLNRSSSRTFEVTSSPTSPESPQQAPNVAHSPQATTAAPPATEILPTISEETPAAGSWSFTEEERSALRELALSDSEMEEHSGAHAVVVSLGGVVLIALLVIIILILLDEISIEDLNPDESAA